MVRVAGQASRLWRHSRSQPCVGQHDREPFVTALGDRLYRRLLLRMKAAARAAWPASWLFMAAVTASVV
jgi:hypothetical protein